MKKRLHFNKLSLLLFAASLSFTHVATGQSNSGTRVIAPVDVHGTIAYTGAPIEFLLSCTSGPCPSGAQVNGSKFVLKNVRGESTLVLVLKNRHAVYDPPSCKYYLSLSVFRNHEGKLRYTTRVKAAGTKQGKTTCGPKYKAGVNPVLIMKYKK